MGKTYNATYTGRHFNTHGRKHFNTLYGKRCLSLKHRGGYDYIVLKPFYKSFNELVFITLPGIIQGTTGVS